MKSARATVGAAALAVAMAGGLTIVSAPPAAAQVGIDLWVREAPPPPRQEVIPPPPEPGHVWVGGHWAWHDRWDWVEGHYAAPPHPRAHWVPGHWRTGPDGRHLWVEGHWR
ncbi:YXWGXW repeat-containing protein [Nitrospirillum pindoramense]|nr:YXWGXW repeat-containing protein [Nitrospirillum amazonense]